MKIAVLSDIHGNTQALQKCLKHAIESQVEQFWFLGDYVGEFPNPQETLRILYDLKENYECIFLRGNKEDYMLDGTYNPDCEWLEGNHTVGAMKYTLKEMTEKDIHFFESLPVSTTVKLDGIEPVLLCHGSAERNRQKLLKDDDTTKEILAGYQEKYVFCGHTHYQQIISSEPQMVINPGSVGVPLDYAESSQYMILEADYGRLHPRLITLPQDVAAIESEMRASEIMEYAPYWCRSVLHVLKTGQISQGTVLNEAMRLNNGQNPWHSIPGACWEQAMVNLGIAG